MAEVSSQVSDPQFPTQTPVGRRSSLSALPLIDSPAAVAEVLRDYFLANADRGDNAANDELIAELVRRIRTQQASREVMRPRNPLDGRGSVSGTSIGEEGARDADTESSS